MSGKGLSEVKILWERVSFFVEAAEYYSAAEAESDGGLDLSRIVYIARTYGRLGGYNHRYDFAPRSDPNLPLPRVLAQAFLVLADFEFVRTKRTYVLAERFPVRGDERHAQNRSVLARG